MFCWVSARCVINMVEFMPVLNRLAIAAMKGADVRRLVVVSAVPVPTVPSPEHRLALQVCAHAYSTTGTDSVTYLATAWKQAEFNIIGDGGGSKATFNSGSSITVKVAVSHGSTTAPTCASNAGTTGETNNLTLGSCSGVSGATPYIQFKESN